MQCPRCYENDQDVLQSVMKVIKIKMSFNRWFMLL